MKTRLLLLLILLLLILLLPGSPVTVLAGEVRVAVAANFLATLKALSPVYKKQSGDRLIISAASTGKLYAQIVNGAPFDVLLSADRHYPEKLVQANKAMAKSRFVFASGRLVLWGRQARAFDQHSINAADVKRVAIASPRAAPYGKAAQQTLQALGQWQRLKSKLVYGESIGQAFQFVASGNAQLGFVALSQVLNPRNPFKQPDYWLVPQAYYSPLEQEAVLLHYGKDNAAARRFLTFLESDAAREVIKQYGYL